MILFLHGPDTWRAQQKLQQIREKFYATYPSAVEVREFDCLEADVADTKNAFDTISLFASRKLLIFRNVFGQKVFEDFLFERKNQLAESSHHIVVLLETREMKEKGRNPLYQWLQKHAKHQEFLLLSPAKVKAWIEQEFSRYGTKASPAAQEALARAVGNNLWQLSGEIKKIAAFKGHSQVKEADIALLVPSAIEADIFATIEAIAQKNKKRAFELLYRHLQKGDSPAHLFAMLVYQFRTMVQIRDLLEKKFPFETMLRKTKLHPYVLRKTLRIAENFSSEELKSVYEKLFLLDTNLKTGKPEQQGVFDLLIAQL